MDTPAISYPCQWSFTLIVSDENAVREDVTTCLKDNRYRLTPSKKSPNGKYISLHLDTEVASEENRNRLFACLQGAPSIRMIL